MKWQLSDEQDAYRDSLGDWIGDVASAEAVRSWLESGEAAPFEERLVRDGWLGVGTPEELGGQGGGLVELALTAELLGGAAAPSAGWLASVLAVPALEGRPELVEEVFAGSTIAFAHPADRIPGAAPLSLDGEGRLSGSVSRVLAGATAKKFVVLAESAEGRQLRLVDSDGVTVHARGLLDRSRAVADLTFDEVPTQSLDADADAFIEACTARAAVLVAADSLGAMAKMLELAVAYSKQRHQFGVPIGSFQAVKHAAAAILVDVEAARSAVYYAAASVDTGSGISRLQAAAVKAQVTAAAVRAADSSLTLHGAIGYTWEHDLHFFYKRAKLNEQLMGSPTSWNSRIADGLALSL